MNNILKKLTSPLFFNNTEEKSQTEQKKEKKPKVSSHIYLGRIKHLREEHSIAIQEKDRIIAQRDETIVSLKNQIESLDIALSMKTFREVTKEIELEKSNATVNRNTLANIKYLKKNTLQYVLGYDEDNKLIVQNVSDEPHLLISGKTGSGKSVTLFNVLVSICAINTPETLEISLIDPKILSFGDSRIDSSVFLKEEPSIFDNEQALLILKNAFDDMMKKYKMMREAGVKDYRKIGLKAHVIFIDEIFELLEGDNAKEILSYITRIASLGRASGVHLVMATQSPRAKTLGGTLKANLNFIGHKMSNPTESKLIELPKAHELKGKGDGLRVLQNKSIISRFQATFIDIDNDETYQFFNSSHPSNPKEAEITPLTPISPPSSQPITRGEKAVESWFMELITTMIETVDENGKLMPKSYHFPTRAGGADRKWKKATNFLHREKKIIEPRNGTGYFLSVDYDTALQIIES